MKVSFPTLPAKGTLTIRIHNHAGALSSPRKSDSGKSARMVAFRIGPTMGGSMRGKAGAIHFARKEALAASHAMTPWRDGASILRSLTRQMGRSTLGCKQQDLWNTVKGLSARSPPAWFPVAGGGINTAAIYANVHSKLPSLTADPCSAAGKLRCISLSLTAGSKGA